MAYADLSCVTIQGIEMTSYDFVKSSSSACWNTTPRIISKKKAFNGNGIIVQLGLEHDQSLD